MNKKSRDLQGELKQVDRLLKFDPSNTTLIEQKQKLLAESIENTKGKLDTLKESERQVQAQFERGEIGEEQYRALQREIIATKQSLEKLEDTAKEFGGVMTQSLKNAGKDIQEFGDKVSKAGSAFGPVSAAATGLLAGVVANSEATKEYRDEMAKLEAAFTTAGHSAESADAVYKEFYKFLGETNQAVEAVNHLAKLTTTQEELTTWTTIATGVYATFGDSLPIEGLTEAANETAKTGALTGALADALNWAGVSEDEFQTKLESLGTEQERQKLITSTLNGLYSEAAEKYREVNGEVMTANENQLNLNEAMAELGEATQPIINQILPVLTDLLTKVAEFVSNLDERTLKIILTIVAAVASIGPLLIIIGQVITAVGTITAALPVLGTAFAVLAGPVGIAAAAVAGLIAICVSLYKNWDTVKEKAGQLREKIANLFKGINWELPKIKLPHFSLKGEFDLTPPGLSVPRVSVDWYDKGGVFYNPAIIGVGERRPEFVGALDDLRKIVREESGGRQDIYLTMPVVLDGKVITTNTSKIQAQNNQTRRRTLGVVT